MLSLNCPHAKYGHLHASEFSSHDISFNNYWALLKTGINLRKLPPAHSRGAVTFSGLRTIPPFSPRNQLSAANLQVRKELSKQEKRLAKKEATTILQILA